MRLRGGSFSPAGARALLCALATGLAFSGLLLFPRLPQSDLLVVPRRPGYGFFALAMRVAASPAARTAASWLLVGGVALLAAAFLHGLLKELASRRRAAPRRGAAAWLLPALALAGVAVLWVAARSILSLVVDLAWNAWFPPESLDLREPLLLLGACSAVAALFLSSCANLAAWALSGGAEGRSRLAKAAALAAALGAAAASLHAAAGRYDAGMALDEAAGASKPPLRRRVVAILTEKDGKPDYTAFPAESAYTPEYLEALRTYLSGGPTVFERAVLRRLYDGGAREMEAQALRRDLALGHRRGDPVARIVLLENLSCAPPVAESISFLDEVADESAYRVGPQGAARISAAYARLGVPEKAAYWRKRASQGGQGIPEGLLPPLPEGPFLRDGAVGGRILVARRVKVGLYARRDPMAPYSLGPSLLVASAWTDEKGRFEFRDLAEGVYYLALAFESPGLSSSLRVRGHRGDIRIASRRPRVELPPIQISL